MTTGTDFAPKRTRESTSKVRTGCSTCKARRVKCDEAKPICRRCAIGRRKCEYNTARVTPPRRSVITVYVPPTKTQPVYVVNNCGLDFFHRNVAAKLDGQFNSTFWSKLVLQMSHSEPSVRHAVSAISTIYQDIEESVRHPVGYVNANPNARKEWNAAIRSLSARIKAHPDSSLVPLVCCLLFTCIEFLKGNIESSLFHAQNGFNILATLHRNDETTEIGSSISSSDLQAIEDYIIPMFSGLNVLCLLAGISTPPVYAPKDDEDTPHQDIAHSRRRLLVISDQCIRFIGEASLKADAFQIDMDDLAEQIKLQIRLDEWRDQLYELVERMRAASKPVKQEALNLLLVHYKVVYIWMRVCTAVAETATDAYHADFVELVHYAEQITKLNVGMATPQLLSFDIQILGPLYYAVLKCRYSATRRRALELLRLAPRREGLWNAHHAYVTAKHIIELEERHLNVQGLPDEASRLHGLTLPDDESRIFTPSEMPFDYQRFGHGIVPSPAFPCTLEARFRTKPWGLLGEWQETIEYIKL
ncbi:hypothetical protein FSARC_7667 [Fusarium sarcochroum]|uniref:Zn(2)-C6 fungal-type domain-containing protein n=1 Tax=Fusarium sarcochroum TaxID=1208366 RepID=A0A8H4TUS0_9HYPO|nr:hypothetical protein FSARC_7667 [Fusarium sarcochroum]